MKARFMEPIYCKKHEGETRRPVKNSAKEVQDSTTGPSPDESLTHSLSPLAIYTSFLEQSAYQLNDWLHWPARFKPLRSDAVSAYDIERGFPGMRKREKYQKIIKGFDGHGLREQADTSSSQYSPKIEVFVILQIVFINAMTETN